MTKTNKKQHNYLNIRQTNSQILQLKKEIVLLKVKQKTKQKVKPHMIKKIKYKISNILTQEKLIKSNQE